MSDFEIQDFWDELGSADEAGHFFHPQEGLPLLAGAIVGLFARMMDEYLVSRVGDEMVTSDSYAAVTLSIEEQRAVRLIEEAIAESRKAAL